ncbi:MAG TPA: OmpA family protein [Bacteroidia bacterium]|jgi:outer membrane protein OmpA-like peptidoglycan-associated protein/tetratricopeptide (TPR) repeat protein|nr:OmpA family protein [Bacteroidia bacterium]
MQYQRKIAFLLIPLLMHFYANGTSANNRREAGKLIEKGDRQFIKSHLQKAQDLYFKALALDSTNAYANFQIGAIFYLSDSFKVKSLPYFIKTIKYAGREEDDTIIDAYYYIGNCYALQKNYPAAIKAFNKYISHIDPKSRVDESLMQEVQHSIEICTDAPAIINRSLDSAGYILDNKMHPVYVKNAGGTINSPYPEYAQVLMNHDSTIIFTSRRPASQQGKKDFMTDEYYEDIFISHKDSGHWSTPSVFSNQLHFKGGKDNLASVTITSDGNTLFIYNKGHILEVHPQNGGWSDPKKLDKSMRHIPSYVPSVFISSDGKKLFLVSDEFGGYGGKDIFESDKGSDGKWSELTNLGPEINSSFDEDSPFLMPDNKTLFFSSKGHVGLGGYDIFKSVYENGKWSKPVNLGPPINSSGDDIYFNYDATLGEGYFSSSRINGGYGSMDIYTFSFNCDNVESTMLLGEVISGTQNIPGATFTVTDTRDHKTSSTQSDANGKYSISLKPDRIYNIEVRVPDYLPYRTTITTPHQCNAYNLYQVINTSFVTDSSHMHTGQNLVVKNAFYRDVNTNGYKNSKNDPVLSALIRSYNDTSGVFEKDTVAGVTYAKAQLDSINPRKVIPTNIDTTHIVTAASIPKMPVVYFAFNKSNIEKEYYSRLDSIALFVKINKRYKIVIEGNTDTVGTVAYNQRLSLSRANAVAKYLSGKGVNSKKLHIEGNGKHHLAVVGDGSSALNRRDDILIIKE